jgi:hypothetical protein
LAIGNPQALVADYEQLASDEAQSLIGRTLRLIAGILARDPRQLLGRLMGFRGSGLADFLAGTAKAVKRQCGSGHSADGCGIGRHGHNARTGRQQSEPSRVIPRLHNRAAEARARARMGSPETGEHMPRSFPRRH